MVQNSFSPKEKEPWINAAWSFLKRITWMFGCLPIFACRSDGTWSFSTHCPSLPFKGEEEIGLDERCFCPVSADRRAESCSCCCVTASECTLSFYSSNTKNPLRNMVQRPSWQTQGDVRHYQELLPVGLLWLLHVVSISWNKFPRLQFSNLRWAMSAIYVYAGYTIYIPMQTYSSFCFSAMIGKPP